MRLTIFIAVLAVACTPVTRADDPYIGEWKQVDLHGLQNTPPSCVRLWLEERTYALQRPDALQGMYSNVMRATPVGPASYRPDCKYPEPASNPIAHQMRMWFVIARPNNNGGQRLAAEPAPGSGDMQLQKTEEFRTVLTIRDGRLIDGDPADEDKRLVFRRQAATPGAARAKLEETITRLVSGGCLEVFASMGSAHIAPQACELRRRISAMAGPYVGLSVIASTEFDRVSELFPLESKQYRTQRGIHFSFNGQYEKQTIPGDALVFEEGGTWRVAYLWF